ncbi:MAG: Adenylate cyclase 1 [Alphaproteobacteria bacterium MarineAlpha2_Bin1]|nr:MAG: Adenylate cyclase 1 [Alphaproteobacteria bacterium MarineAlpha2_Bin1]|tara:strand:+ start:1680 stop:3338 length:1659 start_codon:yes stop_codon:yes gene_type:complete
MKAGFYSKIRLWSGVVVYTFVCMHLLNHSLGLISIDAMERGRAVFVLIWRNPFGTFLLYSSFFAHLSLVLITLANRKTLRMSFGESTQTIFALIFPFGLILHVMGTRGAHELFNFDDTYQNELYTLWVDQIQFGVMNSILIVLVWVHGTIGLYFWLRFKGWFQRKISYLYALVVILPVTAFLGFVSGGREIKKLYEEGYYVPPKLSHEMVDTVLKYIFIALIVYLILIVTVFIFRIIKWVNRKRYKLIKISYPDGTIVSVEKGTTVLEASRIAGKPHASVCGGKGRCSTCRVRVTYGKEFLEEPSYEEKKVLERVGLNFNTRLACQITPTHDLTVTPLLPPDSSIKSSRNLPSYYDGAEQEIAILFADIRAFTSIAEKKLPYDVVFVLNQYFKTMGKAVEISGGKIDKFIGDGVMALFGIQKTPKEACLSALRAARFMSEGIEDLNFHLKEDLDRPIKIGIGIHIGKVILGDMGYAQSKSITAIGDSVNTASRLESLNKDFQSELLVSKKVLDIAELELKNFISKEVNIKGRKEPLSICVIEKATNINIPSV